MRTPVLQKYHKRDTLQYH